MREVERIIQAPLITEKGSRLAETTRQVLFRIRSDANKVEVKRAVEVLFKVKVLKVRMIRYLGKVRKRKGGTGRLPQWKKAYVTLKEGHKIDFFGAT